MARYKVLSLCCISLLSVLLIGCDRAQRYFPQQIEAVQTDIVRFDKALLGVRTDSVVQDVNRLYVDYVEFMPLFVEGVLGINNNDTAFLCEQLVQFLTDTTMGFVQTNRRTEETFADISSLQEELNIGFSRMHYLYPQADIPIVYLFVSGFNASVFYYDDMIGVGLDMYLGSDYPYYNHVVYEYQKQTMRPNCIAADVMSIFIAQHTPYTSRYNRLIDNMIYRGKQMWLLQQLLPMEPNYEIIGYSKTQWEWCEHFERAIWNKMMDKRDLFKTESNVLTSYMNDGPFTAEISQDSPGRLGTWIGWRIVDSYMRHNPDVTIQQLMTERDAQSVLENSYYKP